MEKNSKIYVAGHTGLVGQALVRTLEKQGFHRLITQTHQQLDLTCQQAVKQFFKLEKPDYVFLAAAKVGGIWANDNFPADFILQNTLIQSNVIQSAYENQVKRLLFLGSSCIYPKLCPQPIKEEYLLTGPLEPTNRSYALAKIAGIEMCWAFNRQFNTKYLALMPTNLYGPGDNYDLKTSHVIPALIRKMHEAKISKAKEVMVWGTGKVRREFLFSEDLAQACIFLMNLTEDKFHSLISKDSAPIINVGCGEDLTIAQLVELIAKVVGFEGDIVFDASKPDGTPRKILYTEKMKALGWQPSTTLTDGLKAAYDFFQSK
ncbi:MAG: GDP-L-fucose synthase [Proteobacteria bacterium]|nr:GDP-L-fucose synthase [Pseudomonadota bacterium]